MGLHLQWRGARRGRGEKRPLFTPLNIGLIAIDEEHEGSYKKIPPLRYDAR